jgi:signal transduction histidine kinase
MAKPGQSSFRRILLSRILLLSVPVLLTGEYVAYRKARSILLETAHVNLIQSAIRKGESIRDVIEALRSNLVTASEAFATQIDQPQGPQEFTSRMARWMPQGVECIQLTNLQNSQIESSTCGNQPISQVSKNLWPAQSQVLLDPRSSIRVSPIRPATSSKSGSPLRQLEMVFSAPVYDSFGQMRYALSVQVALLRQESSPSGSLWGNTIVIDQNGTILAHPQTDRVGQNIKQEAYGQQLQEVFTRAIASRQGNVHLFNFEKNADNIAEWVAGYSSIQIPINPKQDGTWIILSIAPINNALGGLEGIKQVLVILTLGLVAANLLATIYIARDLALPLEQLGSYALHIHRRKPSDQAPKDFKIRELNQLAEALDRMVEQLEERAEELETAWQEAQVANQLKSDFLATTSHELRTPLNAIIGCVRLVREGCCDSREEELDFLQRADDASIHLLRIIDDLLNISKIEAGKVELNLQPIFIQELCQQCLRMVQASAEKRHLSLSMEVDPHLSQVTLDERRVRQMVINLLSNAIKFTPEGGQVKLRGWLGYGHDMADDMRPDHSPINDSTPYLCLEVTDSGIGIPQERWHLLFRPFQQVDSSLTRKHEGTGLGLALTKRLAELHGGTLSFQSTPGEGSVFRIWLPSREAHSTNGSVVTGEPSTTDVSNINAAEAPHQKDAPDHSISSIG